MDILQDKRIYVVHHMGWIMQIRQLQIHLRTVWSTLILKQKVRLDYIYEDKYNTIWVLSYDKQTYRFNPQTEIFTGVHSWNIIKTKNFIPHQIITAKSGKIGCYPKTVDVYA